MTKIFDPILSGIERRVNNLAWSMALSIVDKHMQALFSKTAGCWDNSYGEEGKRSAFVTQAQNAFHKALIEEIKKDIEAFAIARLRKAAADFESSVEKGGAK